MVYSLGTIEIDLCPDLLGLTLQTLLVNVLSCRVVDTKDNGSSLDGGVMIIDQVDQVISFVLGNNHILSLIVFGLTTPLVIVKVKVNVVVHWL